MFNHLFILALIFLAGICAYSAVQHITNEHRWPQRRVHLLFAASAGLVSLLALTSALIFQALPLADYVVALRVNLAVATVEHALLAWFFAEYAGIRPKRVLAGISGLLALLFFVNLTQPYTMLYEEIHGFEHLTLPWGERISVPLTTPNAWAGVVMLAILVVPAFAFYALAACYRRNRRSTTVVMMFAVGLFVATTVQGVLSRLGIVHFIPTGSFGMLGLIIIMGMTLNHEMQEERRNLQTILDHVPANIFLKDPEGRYLMVNRHCEETFHVSSRAMYLKSDHDLFPRDQAEVLRTNDHLAFAARQPLIREELVTTNGELRTYSSIKVPLFHADGAPFAVCGITTDITERKQTEKSITRLATAIEQSGEAVVITGTDGMIRYVNPAFEQITGYTRAEAIGQSSRFLKSGHHDAEFYRRMWDVLTRGKVWRGHFTNRRKDGALIEEDVTISPLRDSTGKIVEYVAAMHDVTREVQLEAQFRQAQKMEAIGHLAGGVAHDFNNILAALMMGLELLGGKEDLDRESRASLKELVAETKRAARLTRQLLMFSRRSVLEVQVLDLNDVVANLLKMLGRLLGEDITLAFERRSNVPTVEADAGMLEQVLMNLVVNARDAMPRGGRIALATEAVEFGPEQTAANPNRRAGRFVCLAVADTGCGMDAATLNRIFEPFFTTKEAGKGTGLGLATVYGIVAQHGGWVEVESKVNFGTAFRVYLPASAKEAAELEERKPPAVPRGQETLLVVEDDPGVLQLLVRMLGVLGYRVFPATNGQEAMNLWRDHGGQIDLLLTDMVMPEGMTGLELAETVRAEKPDLKIIISSGYSDELAQAGRATAQGIIYLPKPYELSQLGTILRRCLDSPQNHP